MAEGVLEEYDDIVEGAGDSLVASLVMLMAGIFSFVLVAMVVKMVGDIGRLPVDGNFVVLSAAIVTAAVIVSSAAVAKK